MNLSTRKRELIYAVPLEGQTPRPGETPVFVNPDPDREMIRAKYRHLNLHENYRGFKSMPEKKRFCWRKVDPATKEPTNDLEWMTNKQFMVEAEAFGSAIIGLNLAPEVWDLREIPLRMVGFYAKQSIEYFIADVACGLFGLAAVPIYDTLGEEATLFAFRQTGLEVCVVSCKHVAALLDMKKSRPELAQLRSLIILDPENWGEAWPLDTQKNGIDFRSYGQIVSFGHQNPLAWAPVTHQTIYAFSYTSGTTGEPKGAMISHGNLMGLWALVNTFLYCDENDVHFSYLPMAHLIERILFNYALRSKSLVCLSFGDISKIREELQLFRPTIFVSVPRLYNRIFEGIMNGVKSKGVLARKLFQKGLKTKLENLHKRAEYRHWFWDKLVFNKAKAALGGRVRMMGCGSAPISSEVLDSLKVIFGCPIVEAYGQTEGTGVGFLTSDIDGHSGHVGGVNILQEFKLVDVPEMNYTSEDTDELGRPAPRGEIWSRGPCIIPGYYKQEAQNRETFTEDGWLKSGDIGVLVGPERRLKIIDRKKNIFKLAQGEYIAPEKLENIYKVADPSISTIYVYGDSLKSHLVAILNVEPEALAKFAAEKGVQVSNPDSLAGSPQLEKEYLKLFEATAKAKKLNSLEKIKALKIETRPFQSLGLLTEALKTRRHEVKKFFQADLEGLYAQKHT